MLNANYLLSLVDDVYPVPLRQPLHARIRASARADRQGSRDPAMDIAKRLIDFSFHAPTVYFPLIVSEAMMIEPTETESRETLEAFAKVMRAIAAEDPHVCMMHLTPRPSAGPTKSRRPRPLFWSGSRNCEAPRPRSLSLSDKCRFCCLTGGRNRDDREGYGSVGVRDRDVRWVYPMNS